MCVISSWSNNRNSTFDVKLALDKVLSSTYSIILFIQNSFYNISCSDVFICFMYSGVSLDPLNVSYIIWYIKL